MGVSSGAIITESLNMSPREFASVDLASMSIVDNGPMTLETPKYINQHAELQIYRFVDGLS